MRSNQTTFAEAFETEARRVLRCEARRAGALADAIGELAVRAGLGADFEVQRAALAELLRRLDASATLAIEEHVAPGWFRVASEVVWVGSVSPVDASCGCADYRHASLGACAHVLAVIRAQPRLPAGARFERPLLRWNPLRPLAGSGDWMDRVWCEEPSILCGDRAARLAKLRRACACERFAEPALAALVAHERELEVIDPGVALAALREPLFDYQIEAVYRYFAGGRLLLADDMGLGKTAQAIAIGHVLVAAGVARAAVIVPSPLKWQWAQEWARFAPEQPVVVDGTPAERRALYRRDAGILVLSYEQLRRDEQDLRAFDPQLVILDEAQRIKNASTQTARAVKRLEPRWRLALTGTPLENRLDELASIMEWIDGAALEPRWRLVPWHTVRVDGLHEVAGVRGLATIRERVAPFFLRRLRSEVVAQLPARRDTAVPVPLTEGQLCSHQAFDRQIAALLEPIKRRPLTFEEHVELMRLLAAQRIICNGLALRRFGSLWPALRDRPAATCVATLDSPKLEALGELLAAIAVDQRRKVVVFSQWRRMLQLAEWATRGVLEPAGVRGVYFSGHESPRRRVANLVRFHDLADVRVLWATDAGAVGLNLQRAASCCVNLELPWNPAVLEQRIGRIYRYGQTDPVDVYNLIGVGGIEERIARLLADKRQLFDGLFDGTCDTITFGADTAFTSIIAGGSDVRAA